MNAGIGQVEDIPKAPIQESVARRVWPVVFSCLPFLYLWAILIYQLQTEWSNNPQYSYGWTVPALILGLLWKRWDEARRSIVARPVTVSDQLGKSRMLVWLIFGFFAFLYLPARLVHEAVPLFRPAHWLLAGIVVALTLLAIYAAWGPAWARQAAFPIIFILVAVPWITPMERFFINGLSMADAQVTVELMSFLNIPAILHGKVIEISSGMVGVNDACSGIRSFQSTFMGALFLGELYRLSVVRRLFLCLGGLILAFCFNVVRTSLLVWVASNKGIAAIDEWHDPAGVSITLACMACLWVVSLIMVRRSSRSPDSRPALSSELPSPFPQPSTSNSSLPLRRSPLPALSLALAGWLISVEAGTAVWFRTVESGGAPAGEWAIAWPKDDASFTNSALKAVTLEVLRCDKAEQGQWAEAGGAQWQVFLLEWFPGKLSSYFANRHRPEVCLPMAGYEIVSGPEPTVLQVHGRELPFKKYLFRNGGAVLFVFHCVWPAAGPRKSSSSSQRETVRDLLRGTDVAPRDLGRQVIEIAISGVGDVREAEASVIAGLEKLLK